ncbi:universal stress protein, partial [Haloferax profundi]
RDEGETFVRDASVRAEQVGIETITEVLHGEPYEEIVAYATDAGVDLVVMPTHGRTGLSRLVLGSTTERVVRSSEVPVLTMQPDTNTEVSYPYERVLVPTDGSECATAAVRFGSRLATSTNSEFHALSVVDIGHLGVDIRGPALIEEYESRANDLINEAATVAHEEGVDGVTAVENRVSVVRGIRTYIDEHDIDLVVIGTHGRRGFDRFMLGSVAEKILRRSPVPVVTIRHDDSR